MKRLSTLLIATLSFGQLACTTTDPDPELSPPVKMTAVTYNGGLAIGFVAAAQERAPTTIAAVAELDADVVCVQEFWTAEHVSQLKKATVASFPNSIFPAADPGPKGPPACTEAELATLKTCTETNCGEICTDELAGCVQEKCPTELFSLPSGCLSCLLANIGQDLETIMGNCLAGSIEFAYGGSFGIGVLSSYDIKAEDTKVFDSTTNRRAVIYARLDTEGGDVHAFCTHLTAVFSDIDYPKDTGSWQEEQLKQINDLNAWVKEKAGSGGKVLVMGDMNTGPAGTGYVAEVEANYDQFISAGLSNPYTATAGHKCTFCGDNPLVAAGSDDHESVVIDHVLTSGLRGTATGARVLDGAFKVKTSCDKDIDASYSDHYGVSVSIDETAQ